MTQPLNLNVAPIIIFQMDIYIYYKKEGPVDWPFFYYFHHVL